MIIITPKNKIKISELKEMSKKMFESLVKAVVDIENNIMAIDGELHADEEVLLMDNGSKRTNVWGINLFPDLYGTEKFIEFDSMINLKPSFNNRTRGVEDPKIREKIIKIVNELVEN